MAEQTWFRGEISGGPMAGPAGAQLHDFFDGMYLTDDPVLAKEYMDMRLLMAGLPPEKGRIVAVTFDPQALGRVLDLRTDPRWAAYLKEPTSQGLLEAMKYSQEGYHHGFRVFTESYKINPADYAFVIGPEYVRRPNSAFVQICVVHPDGQPSEISNDLRARLREVTVTKGGGPPPAPPPPKPSAPKAPSGMKVLGGTDAAKAPAAAPPAAGAAPKLKVLGPEAVAKATTGPAAPAKPSGVTGVKLPGGQMADWSGKAAAPPIGGGPTSTAGKIAKNQDAAAMIGVALGSAIQSAGDWAIRRNIEEELKVKNRAYIERALQRGDGVLAIIRMEEWKNQDDNGMKARGLISVEVCAGTTQEQALENWRSMPKLLKGGGIDWVKLPEQYVWIPPGGQ